MEAAYPGRNVGDTACEAAELPMMTRSLQLLDGLVHDPIDIGLHATIHPSDYETIPMRPSL
jgi:hypothetical protein